MTEIDRHLTIAPRHPRVVHAGPRIRLFEALMVGFVVVMFLAAFVSWMMWRQGHIAFAGAVCAFVLIGCARQALLMMGFRRLKKLALTGLITRARITDVHLRRFSGALRADGTLPRGGLPFFRGLEVAYEFLDDEGGIVSGAFLTTPTDARLYSKDDLHEIFYLPDEASENTSSLVMRWYWRLGGPAMVDEAPEEDFPLDEDVIVDELV